ncbi:restriction endonuclease [Salinimicrobium xinjiangense]|uniref:restriction endonuclease n=1 Tax=Salinimicrobium xinjiangense TaxID=438596 RepID=UPI000423F08F|nr:integrase repeat-containing protein [Salinimicrobium xinjiangense]
MNEQLSFSFEIKTPNNNEKETFVGEVNSWKQFENSLICLSNKEKGDAFENLVKLYFKLNPLYNFYDQVWMWSEVPQKELEILRLPSHDLGIDLIAKFGDEYHAIQCKYHSDRTTSVTFRETSTFISLLESNKKITQGYICSSADLTSRNFDMLKTKPINLIMFDTWKKLDEEFFQQARKFQEGKRPVLKPFQPFDHQEIAINEAENYFKFSNRGKLIFPCGAGKSLTGYWITQRLNSTSTIIAVPSLSLVKQTLEVYLKEIVAEGRDVKWLCICSDDGIGKNDDVIYYTENLGVPCYTNPDYIEEWLIKNQGEEIIIFTTYQSGRIIAEITKKVNFTFDVGIFDEAHKTVGSGKKLFGHLLFQENINIKKRIFMTATERFYKGYRDDIVSMDDEEVYGETFSYMSFKKAIEEGLLTDYKVITIDVRKSEIANFIKENHLVQLNDKWKSETEARSLASMIALRKAMTKFPIKNAVSFHSSIEKAKRNKELQKYLTSHYSFVPIDTYTVSGKQSTSIRNDIVQEFSSSNKALITNARCLTEGIDVPNIDCIIFADPKKSKVDIVQALGRALRLKEGKEWGYVILPVVYDDVTNEIDNENFNDILTIVRGLAGNDERIVEYFREKNKGSESYKNKEFSEQFNFEVFLENLNEDDILKELDVRIWERLSRLNWMPFEEARNYVRSLGIINQNEWKEYCLSGKKPFDIPKTPDVVYQDKGWINLGDWLGTGNVATREIEYRTFEEAREFVHQLKLTKVEEWHNYCQSGEKPFDIPRNANHVYKEKGWIGYGDWLGTKIGFTGEYLPYEKAREYVHDLNIKGQKQWSNYCKTGKKPNNIPSSPEKVYENMGWKGYGDWLGTGNIATHLKVYKPFQEARAFVQSLGLKGQKDWYNYRSSRKKPEDIPGTPEQVYKDEGWRGIGDWLGTGVVATKFREYWEFKEARNFVQSLNFGNVLDWEKFRTSGQRPEKLPSNPNIVYKNEGWIDWGDFLGTNNLSNHNRLYRTFEEAQKYVQKLKLKDQKEWQAYCKSEERPDDIPSKPARVYKNDGWKGLRDWLGTDKPDNRKDFIPFQDAKKIIGALNLKNNREWREYCKSGSRPDNIPGAPDKIYAENGWKGWKDFLHK